jgi:NAD(P)-dependent dehydrogenase (short-subunit alcohol dehydrogenase family)
VDLAAYAATIPMQRIATVEDVVGPVLFLLGPASGYVTGQTLHVNGGLLMA